MGVLTHASLLYYYQLHLLGAITILLFENFKRDWGPGTCLNALMSSNFAQNVALMSQHDDESHQTGAPRPAFEFGEFELRGVTNCIVGPEGV